MTEWTGGKADNNGPGPAFGLPAAEGPGKSPGTRFSLSLHNTACDLVFVV